MSEVIEVVEELENPIGDSLEADMMAAFEGWMEESVTTKVYDTDFSCEHSVEEDGLNRLDISITYRVTEDEDESEEDE